jgi:hypothetical protein
MKKLKIAQVIGILMLLVGVIIRAGAGEYYGIWLVMFGIIIYATARIWSWVANDKAT